MDMDLEEEKEQMNLTFIQQKERHRKEVRNSKLKEQFVEKKEITLSELEIIQQQTQRLSIVDSSHNPTHNNQVLSHLNNKMQEITADESEDNWEDEDCDTLCQKLIHKQDDKQCIEYCIKFNLLKAPYCVDCSLQYVLNKDKQYCSGYNWRCIGYGSKKKLYYENKVFSKFTKPIHQMLQLFLLELPIQNSFQEIQKRFNMFDSSFCTKTLTKERRIYCEALYSYYQNDYLINFRAQVPTKKILKSMSRAFANIFTFLYLSSINFIQFLQKNKDVNIIADVTWASNRFLGLLSVIRDSRELYSFVYLIDQQIPLLLSSNYLFLKMQEIFIPIAGMSITDSKNWAIITIPSTIQSLLWQREEESRCILKPSRTDGNTLRIESRERQGEKLHQ